MRTEVFTTGSGTLGEANSTLYSTQMEPGDAAPVFVTMRANATESSRKFVGTPLVTLISVAVTSHFCFIARACGMFKVLSLHTGDIALGLSAAVPLYDRTESLAS